MPEQQGEAMQAAAPAVADDQVKRLTTLQARAALAGWALNPVADDAGRPAYCMSKWGRTLTLPDLAAVEQHLRRVGAPE